MKQIYKDRFGQLADFLVRLPVHHFTLEYLVYDREKELIRQDLKNKLIQIGKNTKQQSCGAVGCAVGWLPAVFPKIFEWDIDSFGIDLVYKKNQGDPHETSVACARSFFDITPKEAGYLFLQTNYKIPSKAKVISRIRAFVKNGRINLNLIPDKKNKHVSQWW